MKTYRYLIADVFTDRPFAGNPLGVFPEATGLSSDQMQRIAGELNLSETAFVLPPDGSGADFRLRIFTPRAELPFAGHPTVGTAVALAGIGAVTLRSGRADIVFAEEVGPIRVAIEQRANGGLFAQLATTGPFAQRECALDPAA
jgi:trans-2,3-dihydro-3-hydroxyanthranilate isomerase